MIFIGCDKRQLVVVSNFSLAAVLLLFVHYPFACNMQRRHGYIHSARRWEAPRTRTPEEKANHYVLRSTCYGTVVLYGIMSM